MDILAIADDAKRKVKRRTSQKVTHSVNPDATIESAGEFDNGVPVVAATASTTTIKFIDF